MVSLQIWLIDPLSLHLFLMTGYTASPLHLISSPLSDQRP